MKDYQSDVSPANNSDSNSEAITLDTRVGVVTSYKYQYRDVPLE